MSPIIGPGLPINSTMRRWPIPLHFSPAIILRRVLIWPDEKITDDILTKLKAQLSPAYYYIDCKMDEPNNAGIFFRFPGVINTPVTPVKNGKCQLVLSG